MKQQIYTLEILYKVLFKIREKRLLTYTSEYDGIDKFLVILKIGELVKEEGLEVLIVKRKKGRFVKLKKEEKE